ncbi:hypothetical protein IWQ62_003655 [Dispira parvispora]|uniref:Uncharacterized protein n=1 Tax=Dispira parvispora TaxID=1520584 RepID=A0A9W8AMG9_9FUNG|nr:hypothetical protein IWQ62_003655 [Dispira parvispora]
MSNSFRQGMAIQGLSPTSPPKRNPYNSTQPRRRRQVFTPPQLATPRGPGSTREFTVLEGGKWETCSATQPPDYHKPVSKVSLRIDTDVGSRCCVHDSDRHVPPVVSMSVTKRGNRVSQERTYRQKTFHTKGKPNSNPSGRAHAYNAGMPSPLSSNSSNSPPSTSVSSSQASTTTRSCTSLASTVPSRECDLCRGGCQYGSRLGSHTELDPVTGHRNPPLTLLDEVVLIALQDNRGRVGEWNDSISYILRGCLLIELALRHRIRVLDSNNQQFGHTLPLEKHVIEVVNLDSTSHPLLDETLQKLMLVRQPLSIETWISLLNGEAWGTNFEHLHIKQLRRRIAQSLVDRGVLYTASSFATFALLKRETFPLRDKRIFHKCRERLVHVLSLSSGRETQSRDPNICSNSRPAQRPVSFSGRPLEETNVSITHTRRTSDPVRMRSDTHSSPAASSQAHWTTAESANNECRENLLAKNESDYPLATPDRPQSNDNFVVHPLWGEPIQIDGYYICDPAVAYDYLRQVSLTIAVFSAKHLTATVVSSATDFPSLDTLRERAYALLRYYSQWPYEPAKVQGPAAQTSSLYGNQSDPNSLTPSRTPSDTTLDSLGSDTAPCVGIGEDRVSPQNTPVPTSGEPPSWSESRVDSDALKLVAGVFCVFGSTTMV